MEEEEPDRRFKEKQRKEEVIEYADQLGFKIQTMNEDPENS